MYSKFSGIPSWVVGKTLKLLSERKTKDEKINSLEVQNDILNMEGSLLRQRRQRKSTNKLENKMVSRKLEEVAQILDMRSVLSRKSSEATLSNTDDESPVPTIQQSESILTDTGDCMNTRTNSVMTLKSDETDHNKPQAVIGQAHAWAAV